jgi:hypothetical protein
LETTKDLERNIIIEETFDVLYLNQRYLSAGQADFVAGLKRYYRRNKQLTEKQLSALLEIKKFMKEPESVRVTQKQVK